MGDAAPSFELQGTGDTTYRLEDSAGSWLILAFYPGDFTPVCTRQFCSYRDAADRLDELDATVLGISPQTVESHKRFAREYELTVPLLSDPERQAIRAYGVLGPAGLVRRSIFIVDPSGHIRHRHVAMFGLTFDDVDDLGDSLAKAKARTAA